MTSNSSNDTKEKILNVAERLFAENGFAGTSLRSIISEAEVNLSAVNYHYGSKEELFHAVVARIAKSVVKGQLEKLGQFEADNNNLTVEEILEAFIAPPLQIVLNSGDRSLHCARFMGRCRVEPDSIREIAEQEFRGNQKAFLDAFGRSLPDFSRTELAWKLDLAIAVLVRTLSEAKKPNALIQDTSPEHIQAVASKLVSFLASGLRS
ncbi:TetR/AcrR family transcriptional regulator [Pleurocapsales cyanobacterium LEGE 10410]|nr:TetR/AcrR family transcriptional regulator [Pleurocapsales cyanobacterium LEGE 10410]